MRRPLVAFSLLAVFTASCDAGAPQSSTPTTSAAPTTAKPTETTAVSKPAFDPTRITRITGGTAETSDNVVKVSFPRDDVPVEVDGWAKMPPFMGLTSWVALQPGEKSEAMGMGIWSSSRMR